MNAWYVFWNVLARTLMRLLPFVIVAAFVLAVISIAYSAPVTVSWNLPTQNEDGSNIPNTGDASLVSTTVEYAACIDGALSSPRISFDVAMPGTSWQGSIVTEGDWCFVSHVTNLAGTTSQDSNMVIKTIGPLVLVVIAETAYVLVKQINKMLLVVIGTIPLGTPCDAAQRLLGHHIVDRDLVQYTIANHPDEYVVVAGCGLQ